MIRGGKGGARHTLSVLHRYAAFFALTGPVTLSA